MSIRHMTAVLNARPDTFDSPCQRFIAVVLADAADDDGECWPYVRTIAARTGYDERTVRRKLAGMVERGLLEKVRRKPQRNGPGNGAWVYRLCVHTPVDAVDNAAPGAGTVPAPDRALCPGVPGTVPAPKGTPMEPPRVASSTRSVAPGAAAPAVDSRGIFLPGTGWVAPVEAAPAVSPVEPRSGPAAATPAPGAPTGATGRHRGRTAATGSEGGGGRG